MIHPTAIVHPGARLGDGVAVGAYSIIGEHVEIGDHTWIGPHVVISGHTRIGCDNQIFQFSSLGEVPQDKKYAGEPTRLEIGDRNTIREFCTFNLGTAQDVGVTRLGSDNWVMAYVHVAHDCQIGNNTIFANNAHLGGARHDRRFRHSRRFYRRSSVLPCRRPLHHRYQLGHHHGCAALCDGGRQSHRTAWNQFRGAETARIFDRCHHGIAARLQDTVQVGPEPE